MQIGSSRRLGRRASRPAGCRPPWLRRGFGLRVWTRVDSWLDLYYSYDMREHISITIEGGIAQRLRRYARRERRPVSQVVEMAIEKLLEQHLPAAESIVTTRASFEGRFSREQTYGER